MASNETRDREQARNYSSRSHGRTNYPDRARPSEITRHGGSSTTPFSMMRRFMEDMDRMFSGIGSSASWLSDPWSGESSSRAGIWSPQIETFQRDGNLVVRADLPGLDKENIDVEFEDDALIISGERTDEQSEERDDFYRSERSYGRFYRVIPLPEGADASAARAQFQNGVLEVTLPVPHPPERKNRRIDIS